MANKGFIHLLIVVVFLILATVLLSTARFGKTSLTLAGIKIPIIEEPKMTSSINAQAPQVSPGDNLSDTSLSAIKNWCYNSQDLGTCSSSGTTQCDINSIPQNLINEPNFNKSSIVVMCDAAEDPNIQPTVSSVKVSTQSSDANDPSLQAFVTYCLMSNTLGTCNRENFCDAKLAPSWFVMGGKTYDLRGAKSKGLMFDCDNNSISSSSVQGVSTEAVWWQNIPDAIMSLWKK